MLDFCNSGSQVLLYPEKVRRQAEFIDREQILFESIQQYRIALVLTLHPLLRITYLAGSIRYGTFCTSFSRALARLKRV